MKPNIIHTDEHVIFINNDSAMMPQLMPGSMLAGHYVETYAWSEQHSGVYAIVLDSGRVLIRRIKENDLLSKGTLTVHSDNEEHAKLILEVDSIHSLYSIEEIIKQAVV
jgi:repressor LexA